MICMILEISHFLIYSLKKDQTGIEPVTLGPAIPCSTTELLVPWYSYIHSIPYLLLDIKVKYFYFLFFIYL